MSLAELGAGEAARRIAGGSLSSEELVGACLERIAAVEDQVKAWVHLDPDYALQQARFADGARAAGHPTGPLHGVPVGIKDIFDTVDMPTQYGTPLAAERRPNQDAATVAQLRAAGAVILGKTVTTELAVYSPGETRNPHDPARTPGGSSSGSAAAVAAQMVPLALGSQTNGSVIRPASFCGTVGFKPSHGRISRHGVLAQSRLLDQLGVFARSVEDAALAVDCLAAFDARDPDMRPASRGSLAGAAAQEPPLSPVLAFVKSPVWDRAEADLQAGFAELAEFLGEGCDEVDLPGSFDRALDHHKTIHLADLAKSYGGFHARGAERLSDKLRAMIEEGRTVLAVDYNLAVEWRQVLLAGLDEVFERYDVIVTPATAGQAPLGLESTGDPAFCTLWTYLGLPAMSLPLLTGRDGLPVGVQLIGAPGDDARLLRTANWLMRTVSQEQS